MNGAWNSTFIWAHPLGPRRGIKRSNITKFQLQSQFQRFLYQTLCVFSQIKDTKHFEHDFHSVAWAISQEWDLGMLWVKNLIFPNIVMCHNKLKGMVRGAGYR